MDYEPYFRRQVTDGRRLGHTTFVKDMFGSCPRRFARAYPDPRVGTCEWTTRTFAARHPRTSSVSLLVAGTGNQTTWVDL